MNKLSLTRTASGSTVSVTTPLQHPTPAGSSEGYFSPLYRSCSSRNIMNLEQRAEEMSQGGSDIGEEIRRLNEESKERSRQNSIQSSHQGEENGVRGGAGGALGTIEIPMSRASSYGNSAVSVNGAARWGGYSPGGYVSSPAGSVHSGSWSHASMARKASASGSSRLAQMVEPMQEGRPLDSPLTPSNGSYFPSPQPSRQASQSSFAQRYDQIASQIEESLEHVPPSPPKHTVALRQEERDAPQHSGATTPPFRPRSTDTFQEAQLAFKDFDGVHFSPGTEEYVELDQNGNEVRRVSARNSSGRMSIDAASLLRTPRARPITYAEPPPGEDMVYYPAPVPRMLNLPKRLSQLPAASVQAKRRSHMLSQLPADARNSAPWLSQTNLSDASTHQRQQSQGSGSQHSEHPRPILNERMSVANMHSLPPQLRASIFFDHQSLQQDVDIKSESAVATLDNILAASATAPVSAFTDHPFAGDVRRSVFAPENAAARRSTATIATMGVGETETDRQVKKRRSSNLGNLLRRSTSGDKLSEQLHKNGSRSSLLMDFNDGGRKLQKRRSQMSFADELENPQAQPVRTPGNEISEPDLASGLISEAHNARGAEENEDDGAHDLHENQQTEDDPKQEEAQDETEEGEPNFAQPTTLLAELQVRKANLKSRNRTAATAYPNGMHSTLLELDAVAEITNKKRRQQRVALAWEDPNAREEEVDSDDDVPLGMLFPGKEGLVAGKRQMRDGRDWERPLGLMEKRELEDNEPLRSRRNRLQGLPPSHGEKKVGGLLGVGELHLAGQPDAPAEGAMVDGGGEAEEEEGGGETLAQRLRRLRTREALDTAISDVAPREGSRPMSTFTDDVLSQFGGLDVKEPSAKDAVAAEPKPTEPASAPAAAAATEEEEETLGQRRARLQRERDATGAGGEQARPSLLRSSTSLANLLAAHPVSGSGARLTSREHQAAQGTLLHASAQNQAKQKAQILSTNTRSSSYGTERPLVDAGRPLTAAREPSAMGLLGQQQAGGGRGGFAGGLYNNGLGGVAQPVQSAPLFGLNGANSYFASPTASGAGVPFGGHGRGMLSHYTPQQQMMSPLAYQALAGYAAPRGMGMPGYGGQQGMAMPMPAAGYGVGGFMGLEEPLDPKQRDAIDRWRLSVMQ